MLNFFKKNQYRLSADSTNKKEDDKDALKIGVGLAATDSARSSANEALAKFKKPENYTGNRKHFDNGAAKKNIKTHSFKNNVDVIDPYTNESLELRIADAKLKYGNDWAAHLAESDHITPIEQIFDQNKRNPWLSNNDIKNIANSDDNLQVVSRKFNNAKRSRTNKELVTDEEYLAQEGLNISDSQKAEAIKIGESSQKIINSKVRRTSIKNAVKTGHTAGIKAAGDAGLMTASMSGIMNITAVIKGEKSTEEALADTVVDSGKAMVTGYAMGNGLTVLSQTLSSSESQFIRALSESNIPGKVITAVIITGDTLKKYGNGEITTQECIIELGEKGVNFAVTGYSMAVGQTLIPIPVVGAAVGALVGSMFTTKYCNELITTLQTNEMEHQERLRIIAEYEAAANASRQFRAELESYLQSYFKDYSDCFDAALSNIRLSFERGDADGMIAGANQITRKLGGTIHYETVEEFKAYFDSTAIDEL